MNNKEITYNQFLKLNYEYHVGKFEEYQSEIKKRYPKVHAARASVVKLLYDNKPDSHLASLTVLPNYTLTAAHAVKGYDFGKCITIPHQLFGRSYKVADEPLYCGTSSSELLNGRLRDFTGDFAVLKVLQHDLLPFTIAYESPNKDDPLFLVGFPHYKESLNMLAPSYPVIIPGRAAVITEKNLTVSKYFDVLTSAGLSGGALVNTNGELLGIYAGDENIYGYAVSTRITHILQTVEPYLR